jgi:ribosomal protein L37E
VNRKERNEMEKQTRNYIILGLLAVALAGFAYRMYSRWEAIQPPPKFNVILFECKRCGKESVYPQTMIARPVCAYCGNFEGEIRREMRAAGKGGSSPAGNGS